MTISEFAAKHRLKTRREGDEIVIAGRPGSTHLFEYGDDQLGLIFIPYRHATEPARPRLWHSVRRKALAAGMTLRQNGDAEGTVTFDPASPEQAKLAIRLAGVKPKRQISEARRSASLELLAVARQKRADRLAGSFQALSGRGF